LTRQEPISDTSIDRKENTMTITAEMPGVTKQDVNVNITDQHASIHAERGDKKYHTDLPVNVQLDNVFGKTTYSNGVLEIKIKLKEI